MQALSSPRERAKAVLLRPSLAMASGLDILYSIEHSHIRFALSNSRFNVSDRLLSEITRSNQWGGGGMTILLPWRLTKSGAWAALLLALGFCAAPASAWAGCGHLVTTRSDRAAKLHQFDDLILGNSPSSPGQNGGESPAGLPGPPRRLPCSGPSCSNNVPPLPVSTLSSNPDGRDRWGSLAVAAVVDNTGVYSRTLDEPSLAPASEKPAIFHPPRA